MPDEAGSRFSRIDDPSLWQAVAGARRVRGGARLSAAVLACVCAAMGGPDWGRWLTGALLGAAVVEVNLSLLVRMLSRAAQWRGRSLGPTLLLFYLAFGATVCACVLVIRNGWGHPLAFLIGLFSFIIGLALGLASLALKPPRRP